MQSWYLEGYFTNDGFLHRQPLQDFPFVMGREKDLSLTIASGSISRRHAQINANAISVVIEDLGSMNGTYVNHERIEKVTPVQHGDIIHLGDVEMRLMQASAVTQEESSSTVIVTPDKSLSKKFPYGAKELQKIIDNGEITNAFQPIVNHNNSEQYGYEILGRGDSELLPKNPGVLFEVAESVGLDVQLSEIMRNKGVETAQKLGLTGWLFINTHPSELINPDALMSSIRDMSKQYPNAQVMLEIHEQAITDINMIKDIKKELQGMNIQIAYDDFGVGQSRLLELVEATPDVLKFDMMLTQNIHHAGPAKKEMVQQLHDMARKLNIKTLAECVSQEEEYVVCQEIGFDLYQGYLFAEPKYPHEFIS